MNYWSSISVTNILVFEQKSLKVIYLERLLKRFGDHSKNVKIPDNFKQIYLDWQSFFLNFILYCFIRKNESIFTIYKIFYLFIIDLDCYMMGLKIMKSFLRKKFSKKTFFKHYFAKMSFGRSSFMNLVLYFLLLFIKIVLKELQFL